MSRESREASPHPPIPQPRRLVLVSGGENIPARVPCGSEGEVVVFVALRHALSGRLIDDDGLGRVPHHTRQLPVRRHRRVVDRPVEFRLGELSERRLHVHHPDGAVVVANHRLQRAARRLVQHDAVGDGVLIRRDPLAADHLPAAPPLSQTRLGPAEVPGHPDANHVSVEAPSEDDAAPHAHRAHLDTAQGELVEGEDGRAHAREVRVMLDVA
mmetsp:Transcript_54048/g.128450  ORF Transcript_54048/g.128450 Transcript_54048/m.128450 type:complete len:213 (-) Transcript_54048:352-990(-)